MADIKFGKYSFQGPYDGARYLFQKPGIFVILCKDIREDNRFYPVDIDESEDVRTASMNHERQVQWVKTCHSVGKLAIGVMYAEMMKAEERRKIVKYIRGLYDMPCG